MQGTVTRLGLAVWLVVSLACTRTRSRDLNRELAEAARRGDTAAVRSLVAEGADVNSSPVLFREFDVTELEPSHSVLMFAVARHHAETVRALLAAGANANWRNPLGETALCLAVNKPLTDPSAAATFRALLQGKADVNGRCYDGQTALGLAAQQGNAPAVQALLGAGANVHTADNFGRTALWLAARQGQAETAELLLSSRAGVNARNPLGQTALGAAAESGDPATVKALLAHGAKVPGALKYATTAAAAEALLKAGADAKREGPAALVVAARMGREDLVQTLLRAGASARSPEGGAALKTAQEKGHATMVARLKRAGAVVPLHPPPPPSPPQAEWMQSPLIKAAYEGNLEEVRSVIAKGTDLNATVGGWAALEAAASKGSTEVVRTLIAAGTDAKGNIGRKAMKQAVLGGHVDTAKVLIAAGVDVKGAAAAEFTRLVPSGHPEMLRLLQEGSTAQ